MGSSQTPGPVIGDPAFVDRLRDVLLGANYTRAGVIDVLPAVRFGLRPDDLTLYDRQVPAGEQLPTLVRLFLLGLPVPVEDAGRALAPLELSALEKAYLVRVVGGTVRSLAQLLCVSDLLLFGDRDDAILDQPGWVAASSPTARLLDFLTVRRVAGSALDLGCGSGMHALLAARHSGRVTAADLNPRAVAFTRLNAGLNEVSNVECRQGSWFEPVDGERFDVIVSNPPFVVSPDAGLLFRDSPLPGDEVSRTVVTEAVSHLSEGGFGHVLCNWALRSGEEWDGPPRRWLADAGCDALVLHFRTDDPMSYAATWNGPLRTADPPAFSAALDRWLDYYQREGIAALCAGAIVVRRRSARDNWVRSVSLPELPEQPAGEHMQRMFDAQDFRAVHEIDETVLRLVDSHEVKQVLTHREGVYQSQRCTITATSGLRLTVEVDPLVLQVLLRLDGARPVRQVVAATAAEIGADEEALASDTESALRQLLENGLVVVDKAAGPS